MHVKLLSEPTRGFQINRDDLARHASAANHSPQDNHW